LGHLIHLLQFGQIALDVLDHLRWFAFIVEQRRTLSVIYQLTSLIDADNVPIGIGGFGQRERIATDVRSHKPNEIFPRNERRW